MEIGSQERLVYEASQCIGPDKHFGIVGITFSLTLFWRCHFVFIYQTDCDCGGNNVQIANTSGKLTVGNQCQKTLQK